MRCKACNELFFSSDKEPDLCPVCKHDPYKYHDLTNYSFPDSEEGIKQEAPNNDNMRANRKKFPNLYEK